MANIMLVDDVQFIKKVERKTLEEHGHTISCEASDGEEAIMMFRDNRPDVVLMDITMPKLNGIAALQEILKIDPQAKVVICSALSHKIVLMEAVKSGAKEYIVKPFSMEKLAQTIEKVLNSGS